MAALSRPVMTPVRRPAVGARERPWPSWASKVLISRAEPSGWESKDTVPVVRVPSTSIRKTLICLARLATAAGILAWDFGNEDLLGLVKECLPDGPDKSKRLSSGAKARLGPFLKSELKLRPPKERATAKARPGLIVEVGAKASTPKER